MKLNQLIKSVIVFKVISLVLVGSLAQASQEIPYYGDDFYKDLSSGVSGLDLQIELKNILRGQHTSRPGKNDVIGKTCSSEGTCYSQNVVGYKGARNFVTREYYIHRLPDGGNVIDDVYCDITRPVSRSGKSPVNVEHTWPQSKFSRAFPKDMQKSDLHHLFPTDPTVNMVRGNHPFGEVDTDEEHFSCKGPRFGLGSAGSQEVFEPPQSHKGNVARALFYFSIRYELSISKAEESILRKWHLEDPVDEEEMKRNEEIFRLQNNRNPFIDFPELVDRISDF